MLAPMVIVQRKFDADAAIDDEETKKKKKKRKATPVTKGGGGGGGRGTKRRAESNPDRSSEIEEIVKRAKRCPEVTDAFIKEALRRRKLTKDRLSEAKMVEYEKRLVHNTKLKIRRRDPLDEESIKKDKDKLEKSINRLHAIRETFESKPHLIELAYKDNKFINEIKTKKKQETGFLIFSKTRRPDVKNKKPDATFSEIGRILGVMWGELSAAERESWNPPTQTTQDDALAMDDEEEEDDAVEETKLEDVVVSPSSSSSSSSSSSASSSASSSSSASCSSSAASLSLPATAVQSSAAEAEPESTSSKPKAQEEEDQAVAETVQAVAETSAAEEPVADPLADLFFEQIDGGF